MRTLLLEEMTWPEIKEALEAGMRTVVIYAASVEQHGPHLAELTDTTLGYAEALDLARRLSNALVAPVIRPGLSEHHMGLPGSITLRPEVFAGIVEDYIAAYVRHGFTTIVLSSSHGGNFNALAQIAKAQSEKYPEIKIITGCTVQQLAIALAKLDEAEGFEPGVCGGHACNFETSMMLFLAPQHVRMEKAQRGFVGQVTPELLNRFFMQGVSAVSDIGVMGDPTCSTAERGERYFKATQDMQEARVREKIKEV